MYLSSVNSLDANPSTTSELDDICPTYNLTLCHLLKSTEESWHCGCYLYQGILVLGMVVTILVICIGSIGNFLSLASLLFQFYLPPKMRHIEKLTADTILIMNLSLADFCYSAVSLPVMFIIYKNLHFGLIGENVISSNVCIWSAFLRYTNAISEWTCLGLMALERCITIYRFQRKMTRTKWFSPRRTIVYSISVWIFGMAAQTPTLMQKFGEFGYNIYTLKCDFMPVNYKTANFFVSPRVFFFSLEGAVPCCLIFIGYSIILLQVYSTKAILAKNNSLTSSTQLRLALRRSKTTRLIMVLLTVYLVCVIPLCVFNVVVAERDLGKPVNQMIGICLYCLYWLQYSLNNFIYIVNNDRYRNAYKQFFCFLLCKKIQPPPRLNRHIRGTSSHNQKTDGTRAKLRIRTPSEMVLQGMEFSKVEKPTIGIDVEVRNFKEIPILVFPKATLHSMWSNVSKKKILRGRHMKNIYKTKHVGVNHRYKKGRRKSMRNISVKLVNNVNEIRRQIRRTASL